MRRFSSLLVLTTMLVLLVPTTVQAETLPHAQELCPKVPTEFLKKLCVNEFDPDQGTFGAFSRSVIQTAAGDVFRNNATGAKEELQKWAIEQIGRLFNTINKTTVPDLSSDWFKTHYAKTAGIATGLMGLVFLATLIFGGVTMSRRAIVWALGGALMAGLVIGTAPILTQYFLRITDSIAASLANSFGQDMQTFLNGIGDTLTKPGLPDTSTISAIIGAGAIGVAAVMVWLALKLSEFVIYVSIGLVALVAVRAMLPAGDRAVKRVASIVMAMGFAKVVVVTIISMGIGIAAAVGSGQEPSTKLLDSAVLLSLGGLAPLAFLAAIPSLGASVHHARMAAHPIQRPMMTGRHWARTQANGWAARNLPSPARGGRMALASGKSASSRSALATTGTKSKPPTPNAPVAPSVPPPNNNPFIPAALKSRLPIPKAKPMPLPAALPLPPHEANPPTPIGGSPRTPNHSYPRRFDGR